MAGFTRWKSPSVVAMGFLNPVMESECDGMTDGWGKLGGEAYLKEGCHLDNELDRVYFVPHSFPFSLYFFGSLLPSLPPLSSLSLSFVPFLPFSHDSPYLMFFSASLSFPSLGYNEVRTLSLSIFPTMAFLLCYKPKSNGTGHGRLKSQAQMNCLPLLPHVILLFCYFILLQQWNNVQYEVIWIIPSWQMGFEPEPVPLSRPQP